jgi:DNA-binding response OmpR family regulator
MYAESLRHGGFTVREVDSTDDGLIAARKADLIVAAIRMPGSFDGIELVRRLRADASTRHKPLIVLTACTLEPDQSRAFSAGCDVFLPKPCLPEVLLAEAQRLIDRSVELQASVVKSHARAAAKRKETEKVLQQAADLEKKSRRLRKPRHR